MYLHVQDSHQLFVPTALVISLVKGYNWNNLERSLSKPFLQRKETEKAEGIQSALAMYLEAFIITVNNSNALIKVSLSIEPYSLDDHKVCPITHNDTPPNIPAATISVDPGH
ncbi:DNA topoisomerase, partial [Massospora cicadina]